ncbi:MAG TPA: endonuclease domain-containing protein [Devosiaceae bacterium]|jgi:very-short-patch-repair endonuclease|nr:endonuclease domain-containing protein [Devosiaceae bacterium]
MSNELGRRLRKISGEPERAMWRLLWPLRQVGHHFRRQTQIGPYFVDFAALAEKLVIEVDGDTHASEAAIEADAKRDSYLKSRGFTVLRFWNNDVTQNPEGVFTVISAELQSLAPSSPSPLRGGVGGGGEPGTRTID